MEEAKELIINPTIQLIFLGIVSLAGTGISAGVLYIVKTLRKQGTSIDCYTLSDRFVFRNE